MKNFITLPDHIHFLAKKLFAGDCGIIDGSIAYLEKGGGGPVDLHTHEHNHLFIVVSGQAIVRTKESENILNTNEALLVEGKIPHSVWNNTDQTTVIFGISLKPGEITVF